MKKVDLYTDGACSGNPGKGGWAAILIYKNNVKEISGYSEETTNNRMELTAVIKGLSALKEKCAVTCYSDSRYVCSAINEGWLANWMASGWKKSDKKPVLNSELWMELSDLIQKHSVTFVWIKGHDENEYNERCDRLAVAEYMKNS